VNAVERTRAGEVVAGYLAAVSIFVSGIGIVYRPVRLLPAAIVIALVAAAMGGRHKRLALYAVVFGSIAWVVGMTIAVATERPLY
jgi:hypothetical protein